MTFFNFKILWRKKAFSVCMCVMRVVNALPSAVV